MGTPPQRCAHAIVAKDSYALHSRQRAIHGKFRGTHGMIAQGSPQASSTARVQGLGSDAGPSRAVWTSVEKCGKRDNCGKRHDKGSKQEDARAT